MQPLFWPGRYALCVATADTKHSVCLHYCTSRPLLSCYTAASFEKLLVRTLPLHSKNCWYVYTAHGYHRSGCTSRRRAKACCLKAGALLRQWETRKGAALAVHQGAHATPRHEQPEAMLTGRKRACGGKAPRGHGTFAAAHVGAPWGEGENLAAKMRTLGLQNRTAP